MSNRELRTLAVPEGVAGERIDSALTRVLGLSRTAVVKLLEDGDITTSNRPMLKSERVSAGQVIEVLLPGLDQLLLGHLVQRVSSSRPVVRQSAKASCID